MLETSEIEQQLGEQIVRDLLEEIVVNPDKYEVENWNIEVRSLIPNWSIANLIYVSVDVKLPGEFCFSPNQRLNDNELEVKWIQTMDGFVSVSLSDKDYYFSLDIRRNYNKLV